MNISIALACEGYKPFSVLSRTLGYAADATTTCRVISPRPNEPPLTGKVTSPAVILSPNARKRVFDNDASLATVTEKKQLADQWGLHSRQDWLDNIERLMTVRRRRDPWVVSLQLRADLATQLGRVPKTKEWTTAIVEAGGNKRDARTFVAAIEHIEAQVRKLAGKDIVPADAFVKTLDGYALGQAVALTTWGVALGFGDVAEARQIIHRINVEGRPAFDSWVDFGLSYIAGRVMHWSDGNIGDKTFDKLGDNWSDLKAACTEKRNGPWAALSWKL